MEILQGIAVLVTCVTAIYGITAWRREHVGKRRIDLAEEVLALFYEAGDVIDAVLSPMGYAGEENELPQRKKDPHEHPFEAEILGAAYIAIGRYNSRQELFARIHSLRYRFMAQNGRDAGKPFEELRSLRSEISRPFRQLARQCKYHRQRHASDGEDGMKAKFESIWVEVQSKNDPDAVIDRAYQIVDRMENICRGLIEHGEFTT